MQMAVNMHARCAMQNTFKTALFLTSHATATRHTTNINKRRYKASPPHAAMEFAPIPAVASHGSGAGGVQYKLTKLLEALLLARLFPDCIEWGSPGWAGTGCRGCKS